MNKSEKDSCILFLMQPSQDRKLLEDFLEDTYRILPSKELLTSSSKVDLCIVDGPSFEQSKPMIAKIRKRSGDVFLPILLVTPRKDVRMVTANAWKQIDDIITSPIEKGELHARLVVLLRIRTLSKELVKQKEYELDRTREALQSSEDIRRALFNSTPLSTFALNLAGQVITWNPAAETMLGFSEEEAIGNQLPIIPENLTNEYNEFLSRLMNGDSFIGYEMKTRRKDGLVFDCSLSGAPIRGTENEIVGTIISMEDITQRKHIEGALSASEKKFRGVFSNDHTIMLIIDPSTGCIEDANPAAVSFYGWDKETLVGMKISDINTMSDTAVSQNLENARLKRQTIFEFRHKRAGGAVRDVEVHSGPIEIEGRSLLYSLVFDVTNKRAAELRLRDSLTEKETLLRELYHRTNNSMQTIHSIMSMYADTHSNSSLVYNSFCKLG